MPTRPDIPSQQFAFHTMHVPGAVAERDDIVQAQMRDLDTCVHGDPDRLGLLQNFASGLRPHVHGEPGIQTPDMRRSEWIILLSDDVTPIPGWERHLPAVLSNAPAKCVGLLHFGGYGRKVAAKGVPYGMSHHALWGPAMAIHRTMAPAAHTLATFALAINWNRHSDDGSMIALSRLEGQKWAMASRSLFQHTMVPSTLNHNKPRPAEYTIASSGPWWGATPRSAPFSGGDRWADVLDLIEAWNLAYPAYTPSALGALRDPWPEPEVPLHALAFPDHYNGATAARARQARQDETGDPRWRGLAHAR